MEKYFFIVSRGKQHIYERLSKSFADAEDVSVVLDRRQGERRKPGAPPPPGIERRLADRRVRQYVDENLKTLGWAFVRVDAEGRLQEPGPDELPAVVSRP